MRTYTAHAFIYTPKQSSSNNNNNNNYLWADTKHTSFRHCYDIHSSWSSLFTPTDFVKWHFGSEGWQDLLVLSASVWDETGDKSCFVIVFIIRRPLQREIKYLGASKRILLSRKERGAHQSKRKVGMLGCRRLLRNSGLVTDWSLLYRHRRRTRVKIILRGVKEKLLCSIQVKEVSCFLLCCCWDVG